MYVQKGKKEGFPFGESDSMSSDLIKLKDPELCPLVHYISFWQNHGPKNVLHLNSLIPSTVTYYLFKPGSNKSQKAYFIDGIISAPPVLLKPRCTQSLLSNIVKKKIKEDYPNGSKTSRKLHWKKFIIYGRVQFC